MRLDERAICERFEMLIFVIAMLITANIVDNNNTKGLDSRAEIGFHASETEGQGSGSGPFQRFVGRK